jgi:hypothetical protein
LIYEIFPKKSLKAKAFDAREAMGDYWGHTATESCAALRLGYFAKNLSIFLFAQDQFGLQCFLRQREIMADEHMDVDSRKRKADEITPDQAGAHEETAAKKAKLDEGASFYRFWQDFVPFP